MLILLVASITNAIYAAVDAVTEFRNVTRFGYSGLRDEADAAAFIRTIRATKAGAW